MKGLGKERRGREADYGRKEEEEEWIMGGNNSMRSETGEARIEHILKDQPLLFVIGGFLFLLI